MQDQIIYCWIIGSKWCIIKISVFQSLAIADRITISIDKTWYENGSIFTYSEIRLIR